MSSPNLVDLKFGRLAVVSFARKDEHRNKVWNCQCDCGKTTLTRTADLLRGQQSCGCAREKELAEKFWSKVHIACGCWLWRAAINEFGYGYMGMKGNTTEKAHRVSWIIHHGNIPDGMNVLHRCDNPPCVNPDHLFLGTHKDNVDDKVRKGRHHYQIAKTCKWGHPWDVVNTSYDAKGYKHCRECRSIRTAMS